MAANHITRIDFSISTWACIATFNTKKIDDNSQFYSSTFNDQAMILSE